VTTSESLMLYVFLFFLFLLSTVRAFVWCVLTEIKSHQRRVLAF
jgi:hypothetical protein